jgi:hypothetical protein
MQALQIGDNQISSERVLEHLAQSQVLPQLLREIVTDALVDRVARAECIDLTPSLAEFERLEAQITKITPFQGMNSEQIKEITARTLKLHKFKQAGWGHKVSSYYETVEHRLHRVIYSILCVEDGLVAQELFFRIQTGEESFGIIARQYSQDAQTAERGGIIGPISIDKVPPALVQTLMKLEPGGLSPLFQLGNQYGFIRLEDWIPAKLDENMHQLLLDELFETWIREQIMVELGQNAEISIVEVEPTAIIDLDAVKTAPNGVEMFQPSDDRFAPSFVRQEAIVEEEPDTSNESLAATTPEVIVVVEPEDRDLDVTTGFFFPPD